MEEDEPTEGEATEAAELEAVAVAVSYSSPLRITF
jgi:hypothetical protein